MNYYLGIDIGSTYIKIVIIDDDEKIVAHKIAPTGSRFHDNTVAALDSLLAESGIRKEEIAYTSTTGYGRKLIDQANETVSEITANAMGVRGIKFDGNEVRTIVNIGGQDLKVIALDDQGNSRNFVMNDKCSAGTGRFLEMVARIMEVPISKLGDLHREDSDVLLDVNSTCTVFAESEIIGLLAEGHDLGDIVSGVHRSIAKRIARLVRQVGIEDTLFFDGGPAMNRGLVMAIEEELMHDLYIPEIPQITTAFGAARISREAVRYAKEAVDV